MKRELINRIALLCAILSFAAGNLYAEERIVNTETVDKNLPGSLPYEISQLKDGDVLTFTDDVKTINLTIVNGSLVSPKVNNKSVTIRGNGVTLTSVKPEDAPSDFNMASSMILTGASIQVENIHFEMGLTITATTSRVINCTFKPSFLPDNNSLSCSYRTSASDHYIEGCAFLPDETGENTARVSVGGTGNNGTGNNRLHFTSCTFVALQTTNPRPLVNQSASANAAYKFVTFTNCVLLNPGATDAQPSVTLHNIQTKGYNVFQGIITPLPGGPAWTPLISDEVLAPDAATDAALTFEDGIYKVTAGGKAYQRLPTNPTVTIPALADVEFPQKDLSGNAIAYNEKTTHSGAWQTVFGDETPGSGGVVVTDITVNIPADNVFFTDTTYQLQAAVFSEDGNATQEVSWTCSNTNVVITPSATYKLNATLHAANIMEDTPVTITLTAVDNGSNGQPFAKEFQVMLKPYVHAAAIVLTDLDITFGYTGGVRAAVLPSNANWKELEWTVDDPAVAGITVHPGTDSVTIKGLTEGTTTVMAQARDNSIYNTLTVTVSRPDYSDGVFIVNEDWWGHSPGSANFLYDDGRIDHNVFQHANHTPLYQLGSPAQYGAIYGGKFYIISKAGLRLAITDARTMELHKGYSNLGGEGRFFFGVDEHTGYVGTANGIRVVNLDELPNTPGNYVNDGVLDPKIVLSVPGTAIASVQTGGTALTGQMSTMKRVGERVFALQQGQLHVINAATHQLETTLTDHIYITMTQAKDGNLWLGTSGTEPDGTLEGDEAGVTNYFVCLDPWTLEGKVVTLPNGVKGTAATFAAWQADAFYGSARENVIYWKGGSKMWVDPDFSTFPLTEIHGMVIFRYDIEANRVDTVLDITDMPILSPEIHEPWSLYGTAFAVDHKTGELIVTVGTFAINGLPGHRNNWKILRVNPNGGQPRADSHGVIGNILSEHPLKQHYWFPAMPVFPDKYRPEFTSVGFPDAITVGGTHPVDSLGLLDRVVDADNMRASIVTTVLDGYDKSLLNAFIWRDTLVVAARKTIPYGQSSESTTLTLKFNSNGHVITKDIPVTVTAAPPGTVSVTGVTLNHTSKELSVGETLQLTATVAPAGASNKEVTWTSSHPTVASVTTNGLVTALTASGTAVEITVTTADGGKTATCIVTTSVPAPVHPFELTVHSVTLNIAQTTQLNLTYPQEYTVTWRSQDESIAMVSSTGKVIGIAAGTTQIIAEDRARNKSDACAVTVRPQAVHYTVSLNHTLLIMNESERITLQATVSPSGSPAVTWQSSNPGIADVTSGGTVIAVMSGNANITASLPDGTSATCNVTVRDVAISADVIDVESHSATLSFPKLSGVTYYLIHLYEIAANSQRIPEVAVKVNPDGTVADIVRLRAAGNNIRLSISGLRSSVHYEADIDVVREINGVAETVTTMTTSFTTSTDTGTEFVEGGKQANAWYADGALRLTNLDGYTVGVYNISGQVVARFNVRSSDEVHRQSYPGGVYFLRAEKDGDRRMYKLIVRQY